MNPPRWHENPRANTGSRRASGTAVIASKPPVMLRQYVSRSGAPGNTAAIPTIAISDMAGLRLRPHEAARIRRAQNDLRLAARRRELGEQRLHAELGIDQREPAARVFALELGRDH